MKRNKIILAGSVLLALLSFSCGTTQGASGVASKPVKSIANDPDAYTWTFADLATVPCQAVSNDVKDTWKCATADELKAAQANANSFAATGRAGSTQFVLKEDVAYPSSGKTGLTMTLKSLDENGAPVRYGKWDAEKPTPTQTAIRKTASAGMIQAGKEFMEIADVQGPFTISITYASNANTDRTDRSLLLKIGGKEYPDPKYPASVPAAGTVFTQKYDATDKVPVIIGSKATGENNFVRIYDVRIK
ncbi:MAG: hypothetical protein IJ558_05455 [Treponema sp.]|nr:hypothetical protein [Treponema sp.]